MPTFLLLFFSTLLCILVSFLSNYIIGLFFSEKALVMIICLCINFCFGLYIGRVIGRRLLYYYLKKTYKNKDITND